MNRKLFPVSSGLVQTLQSSEVRKFVMQGNLNQMHQCYD
jgi:hypothetical protein